MARTVDPARHEARRLVIIDAALTVFAAHGYDGATTAAICRQARIGSGTLFHYFPTKLAVLLGILDHGTREVRESAADYDGREDPLGVLLEIVGGSADEAADPRMPGFVRAAAGVMHLPEVAAALDADAEAQRDRIRPWVRQGQEAGEVRTDLPAARIVSWLMLLMDGFLERIAVEPGFTALGERDLLVATAREFLVPR
ncbi:TetR/AcrR family transcriptional regulator [Myceligenerans pegani]|uniref:TetR/AcrR family transcriptional regulator n=1 Tax=Myceligenerans pegani TaxID=2776917 RepID=A0ABR9N3I3_9MICO|nr:TetR/AcrR family transcriptional regulator [Myceligenerans sp. TRM 65318]MBE1878224.1 TetR/AcrR family transcriptional regulator [Myceligenerans sp. TRM 65318]MBE3020495.1 TetR/AcrR family transcriptional regulator [Myceligenerans sp. TRM 65318]